MSSVLSGILGFLCVSELTISIEKSYDSSCQLFLQDIVIDNRDNPKLLKTILKQSKIDLFKKGVKFTYIGAIDSFIFSLKANLSYLRISQIGTLFVIQKAKVILNICSAQHLTFYLQILGIKNISSPKYQHVRSTA